MSGKLKKLTDEQVIESIKMYESGLSLQKIGDYFGVSRQSMWDLLKRRIELRDNKKIAEENNEKVVENDNKIQVADSKGNEEK